MSGIIINPYVYAGSDYLLDNYGENIGGAYSFRKLSSTYTGLCVSLNDKLGDTLDVGFVNDVLDEASIVNHYGGSDAYIEYWYDQSGAFVGTPSAINDGTLTNVTSSQWPMIYEGGVGIYKQGGHPAARAQPYAMRVSLYNPQPGGSGNGWITGWGNIQNITTFSLGYPPSGGPYESLMTDSWFGSAVDGVNCRGAVGLDYIAGIPPYPLELRVNSCGGGGAIIAAGGIILDAWNLATAVIVGTPGTTELFQDGVSVGSVTTYAQPSQVRGLGWNGFSNSASPDGAEFLIFGADGTGALNPDPTRRAAIEDNIKEYYGI